MLHPPTYEKAKPTDTSKLGEINFQGFEFSFTATKCIGNIGFGHALQNRRATPTYSIIIVLASKSGQLLYFALIVFHINQVLQLLPFPVFTSTATPNQIYILWNIKMPGLGSLCDELATVPPYTQHCMQYHSRSC